MSVPRYGKRLDWIPRCSTDYNDGGAYPEIHVSQFPFNFIDITENTTLNTKNTGLLEYQSNLVKSLEYEEHLLDLSSLTRKKVIDNNIFKETKDAIEMQILNQKNQLDIHKIRNNLLAKDKSYILETNASMIGYNEFIPDRFIRIVENKIDPLEIVECRKPKLPKVGDGQFVPIMRKPEKKLTKKEKEYWNIPPPVNSWKNPHGNTVPLAIRTEIDNRRNEIIPINDKFASFSEALYAAEFVAKQELQLKSVLNREEILNKEMNRQLSIREESLNLADEIIDSENLDNCISNKQFNSFKSKSSDINNKNIEHDEKIQKNMFVDNNSYVDVLEDYSQKTSKIDSKNQFKENNSSTTKKSIGERLDKSKILNSDEYQQRSCSLGSPNSDDELVEQKTKKNSYSDNCIEKEENFDHEILGNSKFGRSTYSIDRDGNHENNSDAVKKINPYQSKSDKVPTITQESYKFGNYEKKKNEVNNNFSEKKKYHSIEKDHQHNENSESENTDINFKTELEQLINLKKRDTIRKIRMERASKSNKRSRKFREKDILEKLIMNEFNDSEKEENEDGITVTEFIEEPIAENNYQDYSSALFPQNSNRKIYRINRDI